MSYILVVDDDPQIRKLLRRILEGLGHTVVEACDGKEAIKKYSQQKPDLVLTDIVMPEKEGIETIMELKRMNPEIKIIAISGGGRVKAKDYLAMAKQLGAGHTIEKPIDREKLIETVNNLLAGH